MTTFPINTKYRAKAEHISDIGDSLYCAMKVRSHLNEAVSRNKLSIIPNLKIVDDIILKHQNELVNILEN